MKKIEYVTLRKLLQEFLIEEIDSLSYDSLENVCIEIIKKVNEKIKESERKENE